MYRNKKTGIIGVIITIIVLVVIVINVSRRSLDRIS